MDEYSYSWVGLSLIQLGTPIGISGIAGYKSYDYRYINVDQVFRGTAKGNPFPINSPWFDHPPLLGLVTGGFAYLNGARVFEDAQIRFIRKPMIGLSVLSIFLLFILLKQIFSLKEALVGSIIYTSSPLAIISSRMVQGENLLIPIFLASIFTTYLYLQKQKSWLLYLAGIIAGISLLVKLSGLAVILSSLFLILYFYPQGLKKALPSAIVFLIVSLSFLIFFVSFGLAFDTNQFFSIFTSNSNRLYSIGPQAFYDLLTVTKITAIRYLTDGWVLAGWMAAVSLFVFSSGENRRKEMWILIPLVCYLVVFLLFGSEPYGWYRFPLIPFLLAAIARMFVLTIKNSNLIIPSLLILLLPIGVSLSKIISIENFQTFSGIWRWSLAGLILLTLTFYLKPNFRIIKIVLPVILIGLFIFSIYLNLQYFFKITPEFWQSAT